MTFNIGSQSAGVINNVAGDQRNSGSQHGTLVATADVRDAAVALRAAVEQTELRRDPALVADVHALQAEVNSPTPDRRVVADRLRRITAAVKSLGGLVSAGVALAGPLGAIAAWLG
jgi:hypothetical protein